MKDGSTYKMWYIGQDGSHWRIGYATSSDGYSWTKYTSNPIITLGSNGDWDDNLVLFPTVVKDQDGYRMWFGGEDGTYQRIGYATSSDGINWTKYPKNPVLTLGANNAWDDYSLSTPCVINDSGTYRMWFSGYSGQNWNIGYATSSDGMTWTKYSYNPVVNRQGNGWESGNVMLPFVIYDGSTYRMWYAGVDGSGNFKFGYAEGWNSPPNPPTPTAPGDDLWLNISKPQFKWNFTDNNTQDDQTAYQFQLSKNSTFDQLELDTGKTSSAVRSYQPAKDIPDGVYYWRVRTWDSDDDAGDWSTVRITKIDTTGPENPASVASDSHTPSVWSNDTTISIQFSSAMDAGSGIAGYSIVWDNSNDTVPDNSTELNATALNTTSPPMVDNATIYFHIRAVDNVGNLAPDAVHAGPFSVDTSLPINPVVTSGTHEISVWTNLTVCNVAWSGADGVLSGIGGYSAIWDHLASTTPDAVVTIGAAVGEAASPELSDDTWYFHIRAMDEAGNWAVSAASFGPLLIDSSAPSNPIKINCSHATSAWSNDSTVDVSWSGQSGAISGVDGFAVVWDVSPDTVPVGEVNFGATVGATRSPALPDAAGYFFHLRTVDKAGNWNATAIHYGPIWIDSSPPENPGGLQSTSHGVGVWSNRSVVDVGWTLGNGGLISGYDGFSIVWDSSSGTLPDETADIGGGTCSTQSPVLPDGDGFYFHIRARDRAGNWATGAAHIGPFMIDTALPKNPQTITAVNHSTGKWSGNATVTVQWSGATALLSGIAGYSVLWDQSPLTVPEAGEMNITAGNETCTATLSDGNGWFFHIRTVNNAGTWSDKAVHLGPFYIDLTPPETTVVQIDDGQNFTASPTVTVNITATDASPGSGVADLSWSLDGTIWTDWEPFAGTLAITLADGEGARSVFARARDAAGNAGTPLNDDIVVDRTAPSGLSIQINGGAGSSNSRTANLTLAANDPGTASGLGDMSFSEDGASWGQWEPFATSREYTFKSDGSLTVYFRVRDRVMNTAAPVNATILIDTSLPKILSATVTHTGTKNATLVVTTDEPCSIVVDYGTKTIYGQDVKSNSFSTTTTVELPRLKPGQSYHFRVSVTDRGGNPATVSEDQKFTTKSEAKSPLGTGPLALALAGVLVFAYLRRRNRRNH